MKKKFYKYSIFSNKFYNQLDEYILACNSLNIIKSHYNYFFYKKKISFFKRLARFVSRYFILTNQINLKHKPILIISNLVSKKNIGKKDFYFSNLTQGINIRNYNIYYRNIDDKKIKIQNKNFFFSLNKRHILYDILLLTKILYKIIILKYKNHNKFSKYILGRAFKLNNLLSSLANINEVNDILKVIDVIKPQKIFFTYEGYAWEKLLIYKIKKEYPKIKTFGYYFSIISKYQNAPFLPNLKHLTPDYVLLAGEPQKKKFLRYNFNNSKLITIGSNKIFKNSNKKNINSKKNIILLPEAFIEEINYFIHFASKCSNIIENKFIIKLHPSIKANKSLQSEIFNKIKKFNNIKISNKNLKSDFQSSNIAIYRGSSSIVEAVNFGLLPIYLSKQSELSIDPLYEISNYTKKVSNPNNLKIILNSNLNKEHKNLEKIRNYCKRYFMKKNSKNIKKVLFELK